MKDIESILDQAVIGLNLAHGTLRDQLDQQQTMIVFLRHFG